MRWWRAGMMVSLALLLTAFGCGGSASPTAAAGSKVPTFDGDRAYADLNTQVAFGPRAPGLASKEACRAWLVATFKAAGASVEEQKFTFHPDDKSADIAGNNIIATFGATAGAAATPALLVSAHWDTRPLADQDPTLGNRQTPIPGANDGASGVAVLTELARAFKASPPSQTIALVCFDLEDLGELPLTAAQPYLGFSLGARYFAANAGSHKAAAGILLDMIGDTNLAIYQEQYSLGANHLLVEQVWNAAAALGYKQFKNATGGGIIDDHKPLIDAGIPCIDLIDLDYPGPANNGYWHTLADTADHCSAASLKAVGQTLLQVIYAPNGRRR